MDLQQLWRVLDGIQSQIRAYDTKAQIVIGIDAVLAAFFGSQTTGVAGAVAHSSAPAKGIVLLAAGISCLVALSVSLGYAIFTVYPRLRLRQPESMVFFDHIARRFGRSYESVQKAYASIGEDQFRDDLSSQILANSIVCSRKAARFHLALFTMSSALGCWIVTVCMYFLVQRSIR